MLFKFYAWCMMLRSNFKIKLLFLFKKENGFLKTQNNWNLNYNGQQKKQKFKIALIVLKKPKCQYQLFSIWFLSFIISRSNDWWIYSLKYALFFKRVKLSDRFPENINVSCLENNSIIYKKCCLGLELIKWIEIG